MFKLKKAEIEQRLREDAHRLNLVKFHLKMIDVEDNMPDLNVVIKELQATGVLKFQLTKDQNRQLPEIVGAMMGVIRSSDVHHKDMWMVQLTGTDINPDDFSFAFTFPVTEEQVEDVTVPPHGTMTLTELPPAKAVTMMVQGGGTNETDRDFLMEETVLLQRWAVENGYTLCDEVRTIHYRGPMHNAPREEWVQEIQVIVE